MPSAPLVTTRPTPSAPSVRFSWSSANVISDASSSCSPEDALPLPSRSTSTVCVVSAKFAEPVTKSKMLRLLSVPATASCEPRSVIGSRIGVGSAWPGSTRAIGVVQPLAALRSTVSGAGAAPAVAQFRAAVGVTGVPLSSPLTRFIFSVPPVTEAVMPGRSRLMARSLPTTAVHVRVSVPVTGVGALIEAMPTVPPGPMVSPTPPAPSDRSRFDRAKVTRLASLSWSFVVPGRRRPGRRRRAAR